MLSAENHALVLIDFEGQMAFATDSMGMWALRTNVAIVAGASKIFNVPTIVTTVAEKSFSGPVFPDLQEFYPMATSNYVDRINMNTWEDEGAYNAIVGTGKQKLVLASLWTGICIVGPALSALTEGYGIFAIKDACEEISTEAHAHAVQRMVHAGVKPVTSIHYLLELQRDWARQETNVTATDLMKKHGGSYRPGIQYAHNRLKH